MSTYTHIYILGFCLTGYVPVMLCVSATDSSNMYHEPKALSKGSSREEAIT